MRSRALYDDLSKIPPAEDPATEFLAGGEHQLSFVAGTRRANEADITLLTLDGKREKIHLEPLLVYRMKGIGYNHPKWRHGSWKGELAIGGASWRCDEVDENSIENFHIQQVVKATSEDTTGVGALEQLDIGPHARYGRTRALGPG